MGRSSSEGSRRSNRGMESEVAEAKMGRSEEEGSRRRNRRMKSEDAEAKMASSEEGTRRRKRSTKSEAAEAKMASSEEEGNRILKLESEEDRKILMKVKSEEGKILKLKKEYVAATEQGLILPTDPPMPVVEAAEPAGKKKKMKKVLVKKLMTMTKTQIDFIKAMATHPCPTSNLTEEQLAEYPKCFQYTYHQSINIRNKRLAYFGALVDQHEEFGCAVDESEVEVTDDEGDDIVEN